MSTLVLAVVQINKVNSFAASEGRGRSPPRFVLMVYAQPLCEDFPHQIFTKCTRCPCQQPFPTVEPSHIFIHFVPWCSATRLLELCQIFWPVTEWKGRRQSLQHSGPGKLETGCGGGINTEKDGGMEKRKEATELKCVRVCVEDVFYVTAVPYCPQKMSSCPWEAALRGETHLSDRIYRDVLWPHPEEPGRRPAALCLPTNTTCTNCYTRNSQTKVHVSFLKDFTQRHNKANKPEYLNIRALRWFFLMNTCCYCANVCSALQSTLFIFPRAEAAGKCYFSFCRANGIFVLVSIMLRIHSGMNRFCDTRGRRA